MRGTIRLGNGQECKIAGTGEVPDQLPNGNTITLHQVRHVPALKRSLVSIGMLAEDGYKTNLNESTWMISRGNLRIESGHKYNNLYPLMAINPVGVVNVAEKADLNLWYNWISNILQDILDWLLAVGYIPKLQAKKDFWEHYRYKKTDPKSALSTLRDDMKSPRIDPFKSWLFTYPYLTFQYI